MVINTSTYWKFDFYSGIILLALRLPLTYFLIKNFGIIGSAFAELAAYSTYNFIRFEFLRRKFRMQPFNSKTIYAILLGIITYGISYLLFNQLLGWLGIILRTIVFSALFSLSIIYWKITPDASQLIAGLQERFKKKPLP
jgi:peptidoglycan biosynthesis protein MviN/MurJ (putative lipid II flippase)